MDRPDDGQNAETRIENGLAPTDTPKLAQFRDEVEELNADADRAGFLNDSAMFWEALQQAPNTIPSRSIQETSNGAWIGQYQTIEKIGEGGFSRVFAARHRLQPNSIVALKVFRQLRLDSWQRLHVETLVLSKFDHPNLVTVLDFGELPDGAPYLVMNRVMGVSLDTYLRQQQRSYQEIAQLFRLIALAIQHAHDRDVVHRDLKPTNIMVQTDGQPVVIDFGLAKRLNLSDLEQPLTASHAVVGTLGYLAPEQAETKKQEITRAVDVYGLGATLYFALTGRPPLERSDFWLAIEELKHKSPEQPSLHSPDIPRDLELICLKCLEKSPGDRYPSMFRVAEDLERFIKGRSVLARPAGWLQLQVRWCQANPTVAKLAGLLFVAVTGGLVATSVLWRQADFRWRQSQVLLDQAQEILQTVDGASEDMLVQTPGALQYRYESLKQSIKFREQLYAMTPENPTKRRALAVTYFRLGKICCRRGLFAEGHANYLVTLSIMRELLGADPTNPKLRFNYFHTCLGLDNTSRELGEPGGEDAGYLLQALDSIRLLVREHPENFNYRDALACTLLLYGGQIQIENPLQSRAAIQQAYEEAWSLKQQLPEPCLHWRHVGTAAMALADICLREGDLEGAESWSVISESAIEDFLKRPDLDPLELMDMAGCQLLMRRIALHRGDQATAATWADRVRTLIETSAEKYPDLFTFSDYRDRLDQILANESVTLK